MTTTQMMTHEQLLIKLSAHKQALGCLQNCMARGHELPLKVMEQWWSEARAKVREIEKLEQQIAELAPTTANA